MVNDVPDVRVPRRPTAVDEDRSTVLFPSPDSPLLATALARSFELVAGIALFALTATALVAVLIPSSAEARVGFAVELVFLGLTLVVLALLLSRRSALAVAKPLQVLDGALAAITSGDLTVRVKLERAAAEIQYVGESVNTMVRELSRLEVIEIEQTKDQRVRRELSEVVHASLDLDHVVQRAVEVVGAALEVDRVHIRLRDGDEGRVAAEWRRSDDVAAMLLVAPADERYALIHLIGVSDDLGAGVIDDTADEIRFSADQRDAFKELDIRAALKFPLTVGSRVAGVLVASQQDAPRKWSDSEVTLMAGFAREIGRALDHALAFQLQDEMVERLGVLDRAKNDFLSEVSRELRGPLASVLGYIELLTDESADSVTDEQRRMLGIVERNGEQLLVLIDNLLTMSRMESGTFEPKLGAVDVIGVVKRVCDGVSELVANGELGLSQSVEPGLDLIGDETQIQRALTNLVSNAVKYTPPGGHIDISAHADGSHVVVDVRDTGVGIDVAEQGELFTRFFSAKGSRRRETIGAGLGLYIVKQIVDGHDGSIAVASGQGRGSTFTMRLPTRPKGTGGERRDRRRAGPQRVRASYGS